MHITRYYILKYKLKVFLYSLRLWHKKSRFTAAFLFNLVEIELRQQQTLQTMDDHLAVLK